METKIHTIEDLKDLFTQMLINRSGGKISKISENSVLNGLAYGVAKIAQKGQKDSALIESEIFPEYAYGEYLDKIVERSGIKRRRRNEKSSVYVRLVAKPNTTYAKDKCIFASNTGYTFVLDENVVVGESGIGYFQLKSVDTGSNTNVPAESITQVSNAPSGHIYCINEIAATGGMDIESDEQLLNRLVQNFNGFALDTISKIKGIAMQYLPIIKDIRKIGTNEGTPILGIVTVNGTNLTEEQLQSLKLYLSKYISISDYIDTTLDASPNIILQNLQPTYIDIDCRIDYVDIDQETLRRNISLAITKYLDYDKFATKKQVDWEELFYIVRDVYGISSLPEQYFSPKEDILLSVNSYPRLRGLVLRNLQGEVISSSTNIVPVYYPENFKNIYNQVNYED